MATLNIYNKNIKKNLRCQIYRHCCGTEKFQFILFTCSKRSKLVTNHGCMAMTFNSIILMEAFRIVKIEKSTSSSVKCEGFAYCFLRLQWRDTS